MSQTRRNTITHTDAIVVAVVSAISAVLAVLSDASPTGTTGTDIVLVAALAGFVTWLGASAPWWALMAGSGIALVGALPGPFVWIILATIAFTGSAWIGWDRANQPIVRTVIAAAVVQVSLRLEWNEFFLSSAIIAAAAMGVIGISGFVRRRKYVRKRIMWGAIGVGVLAAVAIAGLGVAAAQARTTARDGYLGLLDGLEYLQDGKVTEASQALTQASDDLADAESTLDSPLTQMARFVPGVAQNRNVGVDVLADAAVAADSAATTLQFVNLDQLTVDNGVIDIGALAALEAPLQDLEATVTELSDTLNDAESPWLVAPAAVTTRHRHPPRRPGRPPGQGHRRSRPPRTRHARRRRTAHLPPRLRQQRRSPRHQRPHGQLGRDHRRQRPHRRHQQRTNRRPPGPGTRTPSNSTCTDEYMQRYMPFGARVGNATASASPRSTGANVTIPADMPSVGNPMAQMYEAATGREVDGVFVIDPAGVAGLLEITGAGRTAPTSASESIRATPQEFLTLGQYEFAENEREDLLTAVTDATVDNVLNSTLPAAAADGSSARSGRPQRTHLGVGHQSRRTGAPRCRRHGRLAAGRPRRRPGRTRRRQHQRAAATRSTASSNAPSSTGPSSTSRPARPTRPSRSR